MLKITSLILEGGGGQSGKRHTVEGGDFLSDLNIHFFLTTSNIGHLIHVCKYDVSIFQHVCRQERAGEPFA